MATIKQLVKSVESEIHRREITVSAAMKEIGVAGSSMNQWRSGSMGEAAVDKITAWLPESAKRSVADDDTDDAPAPATEPKPKTKRKTRQTPPAGALGDPTAAKNDLIARGEALVQKLTEFGCEDHAATVSELVEKWRAVRSALGA